jgi:hypothetical protein
MEMAPRPAPIAAKAHRPIIRRAALPVSARRAEAICTVMSNLFVCRCEEAARLPLRHDFSKGETCYGCSSLTASYEAAASWREHDCHRTGVEIEHRSRTQGFAVGPDDAEAAQISVRRFLVAAFSSLADDGYCQCRHKFTPDPSRGDLVDLQAGIASTNS